MLDSLLFPQFLRPSQYRRRSFRHAEELFSLRMDPAFCGCFVLHSVFFAFAVCGWGNAICVSRVPFCDLHCPFSDLRFALSVLRVAFSDLRFAACVFHFLLCVLLFAFCGLCSAFSFLRCGMVAFRKSVKQSRALGYLDGGPANPGRARPKKASIRMNI